MSEHRNEFDFWYAVNNTEVVEAPRNRLETFGATVIDYRLVSELMDAVGQVRVREGRIQAYRPEILTPQAFSETPLEGFHTEAAEKFVQWLREHESDVLILKYGFRIRHETITESIVHDSLEAVLARVRADYRARNNPMEAVVLGVDEPWEVCLLKLLFEVARHSAPGNAQEFRAAAQAGERREIEQAFRSAAHDRGKLSALADLLRAKGKFSEYEDRFYSLVKLHSR